MKKIILIILLCILLLEGIALATLSYDEKYYMQNLSYVGSGSSVTDPLFLFMNESIGYLEGSSGFGKIYMTPTNTAPTAAEGLFYYSDSGNQLQLCTSTSPETWVSIDTAGASSLDAGYGISAAVTVDAGAITLTAPNTNDNVVLALVQADNGGGTVAALTVASAGNAAAIIIAQTGSGTDIQGSAGWNITKLGVGTFLGLSVGASDLVFATNGEFIANDTDQEFEFDSDQEDFTLDLSNSDIVKFTSDTQAYTLELDTLDDVNGVGNIYFDSASSQITLAANETADDLLIQVTGAYNASLDLRSAGTAVDAIIVRATAGGIDMDATDDIAITVTSSGGGEDLLLTQVGSNDSSIILTVAGTGDAALDFQVIGGIDADAGKSINLTSSEDSVDAIRLSASAGGIDIDAAGEAGQDITITNTGGSIQVLATENDAGAMHLEVDSGTSSAIMIFNDTGTSTTEKAASIQLLSDVGSIELWSGLDAGDAINIMVESSTSSGIMIFNDTGTGVCATTEFDASIQLISDDGGISLYSTANLADAIRIEANGGVSETVAISSVKGTGAGSIDLDSLVGGITIETQASGKDILLDAVQGSVVIEGQETGATDAVLITADGDGSTRLKIHNDTGTGANSILLLSDEGGITITASAVATATKGLVVSGTADTGCVITEGGGLYASFNSTEDAVGLLKAVGFWLDITDGTPTAGASMIALDVGVYQAESNADLTSATVKVINMEYQGTTSGDRDSTSVYWFNFNSAGHHPTAWFHCNGANNIALTENSTHTSSGNNKLGAIAIRIDSINGGALSYIYVYSDAGS